VFIKVDFKTGVPAYLQIVDQVKRAAASGSLQAGDALPPIRTLAERLSVNRNTVAKAYSELESQDVIETKVGRGCVIAANQSPLKKAVRQRFLDEAIDAAIIQSHHLQFNKEEFLKRVELRVSHFQQQKDQNNKQQPEKEL
jgi:GntR family transcriptional regulator